MRDAIEEITKIVYFKSYSDAKFAVDKADRKSLKRGTLERYGDEVDGQEERRRLASNMIA